MKYIGIIGGEDHGIVFLIALRLAFRCDSSGVQVEERP